MGDTTKTLDELLRSNRPGQLKQILSQEEDNMFNDRYPFSAYMKTLFKAKKNTRQNIFRAAYIPEGYGYKLISMEKVTKKRDVILRICLALHCSVTECNTALKLYGMSELYSRVYRDAAIIIEINSGIFDIDEINDFLRSNGFAPLEGCREEE